MKKEEREQLRASLLEELRLLVRSNRYAHFSKEPIKLRYEDVSIIVDSIFVIASRDDIALSLRDGGILYAKYLPAKTLSALLEEAKARKLEPKTEYRIRADFELSIYADSLEEAKSEAERIVREALEDEVITKLHTTEL